MAMAADHPFPVVGVGASAGGFAALRQLLSALPPVISTRSGPAAASGFALVIVQHLDPRHESHLSELLRPHSSMPVVDAAHGVQVEPDHVYVIQPNTSVAIVDGVLSVTPRPDDRRPHYPVDHFLRSLASVQGPHAVGVILSGTGSDGTLGVCEIKAAGGVTFAQDEASAQHAGMPQSAIAQRGRRSGAAAGGDRRTPGHAASSTPTWRPVDVSEPSDRTAARRSSSASSPRFARAPASISASIATRPSSGAPPGACCCADSPRRATMPGSSNATATKPARSIATS